MLFNPINSLFDDILLLPINLDDIEEELGGFLMGLLLVCGGGLHVQLKSCLMFSYGFLSLFQGFLSLL